jgi:4-hydroxy-tetrahydrodipicolinate synthase
MQTSLNGVLTPVATPFTKGGESVDIPALRKLIDALVDSRCISALIATAATGQFASLSDKERAEVVEVTIEQAAGRLPVIVGTGAASTHEAIRWTKHAASLGAVGAMVVPPFYGPTPAAVSVKGFAAISDACDLPIMIYNAPYAAHNILMPEHIAEAVRVANIRWVKLTTGVLDHHTWIRELIGDKVQIFEGVDTLAFAAFCMGADGWIAGPSNMVPELTFEMWKRVKAGDIAGARRLQGRMFALLQSMRENMAYYDVINEVCGLRGLPMGDLRLPGLHLEGAHLERVRAAARGLGLVGVGIGKLDASTI